VDEAVASRRFPRLGTVVGGPGVGHPQRNDHRGSPAAAASVHAAANPNRSIVTSPRSGPMPIPTYSDTEARLMASPRRCGGARSATAVSAPTKKNASPAPPVAEAAGPWTQEEGRQAEGADDQADGHVAGAQRALHVPGHRWDEDAVAGKVRQRG
jgi:hypothetical protein